MVFDLFQVCFPLGLGIGLILKTSLEFPLEEFVFEEFDALHHFAGT